MTLYNYTKVGAEKLQGNWDSYRIGDSVTVSKGITFNSTGVVLTSPKKEYLPYPSGGEYITNLVQIAGYPYDSLVYVDYGAHIYVTNPQFVRRYVTTIDFHYIHTGFRLLKNSVATNIIGDDSILPINGLHSDGFWYIRKELANSAPTISGTDKNLGDKNSGFTVTYSVNDLDASDKLTVKEKINGITIRTLTNAPRNALQTITVTDEMLYGYNLLATNTIEIEVNDNKGSVVYRRFTFKRTNTAPKISGQDTDLGEKTEGFDITFSATDQENDTMSAKLFINDKIVQTYESLVSAQEYTYTLSKLDFVQLDNKDEHKIRIEVQDHNNATSIRNYTFTRKVGRVMYAFEKETDIMATQILISPTWSIAEGAVAEVLVCNNAYDDEPTWEDATEQVLLERHFNFINAEKTGATWGIGVQIIINKGNATELSYLAGFGGAYK